MVDEPQRNFATFDVWTIPHFVLGVAAKSAGVPFLQAFWYAVALEAVEIGISDQWPNLARESRANQLGDLAAFGVGYMVKK